ncbi:MAG TPA: hypothetical protein VFW77_01575 [Candidatus Saccharimonadales bacterium]|nr:hypothetical protein [Candidatus Saccharimonadales bacterium]
MAESKDTIYIDVDEEITGIIDKVQNSPKDIVALVLPKRASVLQSIVNMKLLKRAQDQNSKKIVLITSETRILPLAGATGLFVASNLTSKPYIPPVPKPGGATPAPAKSEPEEVEVDPHAPVSQVAPDAKFADTGDEIEIDNTPKPAEAAAAAAKKPKKKNKIKVPNFGKFRKKAVIIALIVLLLILGLIWALFIAPKANVTLKAQTNKLPVSFGFVADPNASGVDTANSVVRASTRTDKQDFSETVNTSGTQNKGKKASGSVTMTAKKCSGNPFNAPSSVPAGTGVSAGGATFITQDNATFTTSGATTDSDGCFIYPATHDINITAQSGGKDGNVSNADFSVSGRSDVSASGSASGGTDNIVKVVTQADVDKAKERLNGEPNEAHDKFVSDLKDKGYVPLEDSFKATPGDFTVTPAVNSEGEQVTVSVTKTYTMMGVNQDDLQKLIDDQVKQQEGGKSQSILSYGIDQADIKFNSAGSLADDGQTPLTIDTEVVVGPNLNQDDIKNKIAGKKSGEAQDILGQIPGVKNPTVELSPFWVGHVPGNHSKINIVIQQSDGSSIP